MVGSVASLVKQTVVNNVVSRQVKKGVKGILGIFKKKEDTQETQEDVISEDSLENIVEHESDALSPEEEQNSDADSMPAEEKAEDSLEPVS